jgi:hypothetical protein
MQPLLQWGSSRYYIFRVCVCSFSYPACNAHAPYCRLWPAALCNIFPHSLTNYIILGGKKRLPNIKCVFWFSLHLLPETFLVIRRTERDMIKNVYCDPHVKYPSFSLGFNKTLLFPVYFRKILKYQISWKSVQWEPCCPTRTDGQTDMAMLTVAFRNFANAPKQFLNY